MRRLDRQKKSNFRQRENMTKHTAQQTQSMSFGGMNTIHGGSTYKGHALYEMVIAGNILP